MSSLFVALFALVTSSFRTRVALQAEILALRHQLAVFQKNAPRRLRLRRSDRRPRKPPSQTWRTCLTNHMEQMASIDFFVVPTATFRVLFVFVVLSNARRRVLHFQVTEHPSQEWTMQQMREAFPWDQPCRYLLRDRDAIYGGDWVAMTKGLGMEEVISAPRSPWQNPYVERLIGSIRRECLDHIIVWRKIVAPDSERLFCLLPALPNPFGIGQGRSGVESSGEARKRVHRRDSSAWRTPPQIPTPRRLVLAGPRRR